MTNGLAQLKTAWAEDMALLSMAFNASVSPLTRAEFLMRIVTENLFSSDHPVSWEDLGIEYSSQEVKKANDQTFLSPRRFQVLGEMFVNGEDEWEHVFISSNGKVIAGITLEGTLALFHEDYYTESLSLMWQARFNEPHNVLGISSSGKLLFLHHENTLKIIDVKNQRVAREVSCDVGVNESTRFACCESGAFFAWILAEKVGDHFVQYGNFTGSTVDEIEYSMSFYRLDKDNTHVIKKVHDCSRRLELNTPTLSPRGTVAFFANGWGSGIHFTLVEIPSGEIVASEHLPDYRLGYLRGWSDENKSFEIRSAHFSLDQKSVLLCVHLQKKAQLWEWGVNQPLKPIANVPSTIPWFSVEGATYSRDPAIVFLVGDNFVCKLKLANGQVLSGYGFDRDTGGRLTSVSVSQRGNRIALVHFNRQTKFGTETPLRFLKPK